MIFWLRENTYKFIRMLEGITSYLTPGGELWLEWWQCSMSWVGNRQRLYLFVQGLKNDWKVCIFQCFDKVRVLRLTSRFISVWDIQLENSSRLEWRLKIFQKLNLAANEHMLSLYQIFELQLKNWISENFLTIQFLQIYFLSSRLLFPCWQRFSLCFCSAAEISYGFSVQ